jgi:hypothetical protein
MVSHKNFTGGKMRTCLSITFLLALAACGGDTRDGALVKSTAPAPALLASVTSVAAKPSDYHTVVQQLYIAYFGRPADTGGLTNFASELARVGAPTDIQLFNAAYQNNATVRALIDQFGASAESQNLYQGDTRSFVTAIYRNVLNRAPEPDGLAFWSGAIDSRALTKGNASLSIMAGALANTSSQGLLDGTAVRNKVLAGLNFTASLTTPEKAGAYAGDAAAAAARQLLAGVSTSSTPATIQSQIDTTVSQLLAASGKSRVFRGTVALGSPVKDAVVSVFDRGGLLGQTVSDLQGKYLLPAKLVSALTPPYIVKAEFTLAGRKISLFSISTDANGENLQLNVTPVTDMITRGYVPAGPVPDPMAPLYNDPSRLAAITSSVRKVFGPLLPATAGDPISGAMTADPRVDAWDATLERLKIDTVNGQTTIKNINDKLVATVASSALATGAGTGDADTITATESSEAIATRGEFDATVQRYVNEAPPGALPAPANFRAVKTGTLGFKLSWDRVDQARQYYVYEQKDSEPGITSGRYPVAQTVPSYATGGNGSADVELEYTVSGSGTYYWVIGAVAQDGSVTEYTLGTTSEPVSLTFDTSKPLTCVTEPLPASSTTGKLSYCYYETGTAPFTSRKRHGPITYVNNGHLVYLGNYTDNVQDGKWSYYLTDAPYTLSQETYYAGGAITFEKLMFGSSTQESVWKKGTVKSNYIATTRNYCGTLATIPESRRGALYSILTGTDSLKPPTSENVLKCGANNGTSGEACCKIP